MHEVRFMSTTAVAAVIASAVTVLTLVSPANAEDAAEGPFSLTVRAGGFDERCLRLQANEMLDYRFSADGTVDFNIHYHRGSEVVYPVRQVAVSLVRRARFVASATDDYCLMWQNRGTDPVRIDGRLARLR